MFLNGVFLCFFVLTLHLYFITTTTQPLLLFLMRMLVNLTTAELEALFLKLGQRSFLSLSSGSWDLKGSLSGDKDRVDFSRCLTLIPVGQIDWRLVFDFSLRCNYMGNFIFTLGLNVTLLKLYIIWSWCVDNKLMLSTFVWWKLKLLPHREFILAFDSYFLAAIPFLEHLCGHGAINIVSFMVTLLLIYSTHRYVGGDHVFFFRWLIQFSQVYRMAQFLKKVRTILGIVEMRWLLIKWYVGHIRCNNRMIIWLFCLWRVRCILIGGHSPS